MTSITGRKIVLLNAPTLYNRIVTLDEGTWSTGTVIYKHRSVQVRKVGDTWRQVPPAAPRINSNIWEQPTN